MAQEVVLTVAYWWPVFLVELRIFLPTFAVFPEDSCLRTMYIRPFVAFKRRLSSSAALSSASSIVVSGATKNRSTQVPARTVTEPPVWKSDVFNARLVPGQKGKYILEDLIGNLGQVHLEDQITKQLANAGHML